MQRVSLKVQSANPLFEKWLMEWKEEAKARNSKSEHSFNLALKSLRAYPLPLNRGKDCKILKGFGNKLCEMLDNALKEHNDLRVSSNQTPKKKRPPREVQTVSTESKGDYVPAYRSGGYAVLVTLYKNALNGGVEQGFMYKKDLIKGAQVLCDHSFSKSDNGNFYTAWSSTKTLFSKNLIRKEGNPMKIFLTEAGKVLAEKLCREQEVPQCSPIREHTDVSSDDSKDEDVVLTSTPDVVLTPEFQDIVLAAGSFDIVLIIDNHETNGAVTGPEDDPLLIECADLKLTYEIKDLKVGDYCWICRDRNSGAELVTPYIVERKRIDDLASSIKSGRFHEQKFRLSQCGLQNVIYLIEEYRSNHNFGIPYENLMKASVNTLIQDGFCVKFVDGVRGVAKYLSCMTNILKKRFGDKIIASCPKENIATISIDDDFVSLMYFQDFNRDSEKTKDLTVKDLFVKQLLQISGLSVDKALAIVEIYPTPKRLSLFLQSQSEKDGVKRIAEINYGTTHKKIGLVLANILYKLFVKTDF